ncbi:hypothetical protein CEXT_262791 [Caerostris extrusa]|uniref:Uncharacterized protein n=1 Tax=Caerostris extrusa TaxID=172846 RepID=A0AAV4WCN9_CAEEX|nr:hypothetical protein CEXT_262791 [Caerostris extrusa]
MEILHRISTSKYKSPKAFPECVRNNNLLLQQQLFNKANVLMCHSTIKETHRESPGQGTKRRQKTLLIIGGKRPEGSRKERETFSGCGEECRGVETVIFSWRTNQFTWLICRYGGPGSFSIPLNASGLELEIFLERVRSFGKLTWKPYE